MGDVLAEVATEAKPGAMDPRDPRRDSQIKGESAPLEEMIQGLRNEIAQVRVGRADAVDPASAAAADPKPDFKILSDEEFEQLAADDPVEAIRYDRQLRRHEEAIRQARAKKAVEQERVAQTIAAELAESRAAMQAVEALVPGIYAKCGRGADRLWRGPRV
jgi:hypothetical protein